MQRINSPPAQIEPAPELGAPVPAALTTEPPAQPAPPLPQAATNPPSVVPEPKGCRIQVSSTRSRAQAETIAVRLARLGYLARVELADLHEKGTWYRVQLHGYSSCRAAAAAADKLRADSVIEDYWLVH
jgi:cell division protein FtsN